MLCVRLMQCESTPSVSIKLADWLRAEGDVEPEDAGGCISFTTTVKKKTSSVMQELTHTHTDTHTHTPR